MLRRSLLAAVLCCASLAACEGRTPADPSLRIQGTYDLVSVDGEPVPYTIFINSARSLINSGSITLLADGRFRRQEVRQYTFGPEAFQDSGTYELRGDSLSLVTRMGTELSVAAPAALSDTAIVVRWQHGSSSRIIGLPFVYRKR